jgi:hypothetical protein
MWHVFALHLIEQRRVLGLLQRFSLRDVHQIYEGVLDPPPRDR